MNIIGQVLLWGGFLAGSLATVLNLEVKSTLDSNGVPVDPWEKWSTIPWTWYLISVGVCIVGIVLLRMGKKAAMESSETSAASLLEVRNSLKSLLANLDELKSSVDKLAPSEITSFIDDKLAGDFRTFADGRESITTEMGLQKFADVMSQFAAGERAINRAWSAAADGYVDEAATCIERGAIMLEVAQEELG